MPEVYSADSGHSTAASIALSPSYNDEDDSTIRQAKEASRAELELNDACLQSILLQTQLEAEERDLQEALRLSAMVTNHSFHIQWATAINVPSNQKTYHLADVRKLRAVGEASCCLSLF